MKASTCLAILASALFVFSSGAQALLAIGNVGAASYNASMDLTPATNDNIGCFGFTTDASTQYNLTSVEVVVSSSSGTPDPVMRLHPDSSGNPSDTILATFTDPGSFGDGTMAFTLDTPYTMDTNTPYWISLYNETDSFWWDGYDSAQAPTSAVGFTSNDFTIGFSPPNVGTNPMSMDAAINVYATAVPEPGSAALFALVGLLSVARRRRRASA